MNDTIRVRVVEFSDRKTYQLQWTDPDTGRKKTKATDVERTGRKRERDDASKAAGEWEKKLNSGEVVNNHRLTWEQFRQRYDREVMAGMAKSTQGRIDTVFDSVERIIRPQRLANLTAGAISDWLAKLQEEGRAAATAGIHGRALHSALNWAHEQKLIGSVPKFRIPQKQAGASMAKGRALCGEEHDRMKEAVGKVLRRDVDAWKRLLDGLWHSGFRLGEAVTLSWEPTAAITAIVVPGRRPVVRFRASGQKARRDEIWPCPPEFAAMLEAVPEAERTGYVFKLPKRRSPPGQTTIDKAGRIIGEIGEKAGIITGDAPDDYATAHSYRRAFGTRWAKRVMPAVLKRLMRHADIKTTMAYYVDHDAESIADELYQRFGNGNESSNTAHAEVANS